MPEGRIHIWPDQQTLFAHAARHVAQLLLTAQQEGRTATLALAGGNTPGGLYRQLAQLPDKLAPDWHQVQFFFGDERAVGPDHPDSNFLMAQKNLFEPLHTTDSQIHRIRAEQPQEWVIQDYLQQLQTLPQHEGWPCFELILLGMGNDGHIASLFPDSPQLAEQQQSFSGALIPQMGVQRYSLTLPVLNHARHLLLLVSGQDKAATIKKVFNPVTSGTLLPVQQLAPDRLEWFLDQDAASLLDNGRSS